jgi:hypothetical protein
LNSKQELFNEEIALTVLNECDYNVEKAILMIQNGGSLEEENKYGSDFYSDLVNRFLKRE